jgi:hypothetical protein
MVIGITTLSGFVKALIYNLSEFKEPDRVKNQTTFWTTSTKKNIYNPEGVE